MTTGPLALPLEGGQVVSTAIPAATATSTRETVLKAPTCTAQSVDLHGEGNFPQGCSFSPDGLCIATATAADATLRLYNTVNNSNSNSNPNDNDETNDSTNTTHTTVHQPWKTALTSTVVGEVIRSYDWYPPMQSSIPATCCLIATGRDQPVQLIDAYTGTSRATYSPMNSMDEMESPTVIQFSPHDGQHIVTAGFRTERMIQIFDSTRPGKSALTTLKLGQTKRSSDGQKGLVSAVAFSSSSATEHKSLLAVGTYAPGSIYLYDFRQGCHQPSGTIWNGCCIVGHGKKHASRKRRFATPTMNDDDNNNNNDEDHDDDGLFFSKAKTQWYAHRAQRGVTQLQFDATGKLYSACRNADSILVWDVRMLSGNPTYSNMPIRGYSNFPIEAHTNQRLEFALDDASNRLWVGGLSSSSIGDGDNDAMVRVYDTSVEASSAHKLVQQVSIPNCAPGDAVNGLSYNATYDMLAVATGSRRFPSEADYEDNDNHDGVDLLPPGSLQLYKWNSCRKDVLGQVLA